MLNLKERTLILDRLKWIPSTQSIEDWERRKLETLSKCRVSTQAYTLKSTQQYVPYAFWFIDLSKIDYSNTSTTFNLKTHYFIFKLKKNNWLNWQKSVPKYNIRLTFDTVCANRFAFHIWNQIPNCGLSATDIGRINFRFGRMGNTLYYVTTKNISTN